MSKILLVVSFYLILTPTARSVEETDQLSGNKNKLVGPGHTVSPAVPEAPASDEAPVLEFIPDQVESKASPVWKNEASDLRSTKVAQGQGPTFLRKTLLSLDLNLVNPGFLARVGYKAYRYLSFGLFSQYVRYPELSQLSSLGLDSQLSLPLSKIVQPFLQVSGGSFWWKNPEFALSGPFYGTAWGLSFPMSSYFGFRISRNIDVFPYKSRESKKTSVYHVASFYAAYSG